MRRYTGARSQYESIVMGNVSITNSTEYTTLGQVVIRYLQKSLKINGCWHRCVFLLLFIFED